ncbi:MAG: ABC transporter ATP-binding protein [Thermicanus sp.]|nr:ABC transporter ATP-binding protein [Thermicanus sp.]
MTQEAVATSSAKIDIQRVSKIYSTKHGKVVALDQVSLSIWNGEFYGIVGPSGCGKSTLLRMVAGLDHPTKGRILIDNQLIEGPGADRGMVFQTYTLYPWLTVRENVQFGLRLKGVSKKERDTLADYYLEKVGLKDFSEVYPKMLSGGMKQRAAIARALANRPQVLLMDEPFGALDAQTKVQLQQFLSELWESEQITILFITHDIEEALFLSQRVAVMNTRPGRIQQEFVIPFSHRDEAVRDHQDFIQMKREIFQLLAS